MKLGEMNGKQVLDAFDVVCYHAESCDQCHVGHENCKFKRHIENLIGNAIICRCGARIDANTRLDIISADCKASRADANEWDYRRCETCLIGRLVDELPDLNMELPDPNLGEEKPDPVFNPAHYTQGVVECIDAIESAVADKDGIEAFLTGTILKYLWRYRAKNGIEDLRKAQCYLSRLIDIVE